MATLTTVTAIALLLAAGAAADRQKELEKWMTRGKLEADLGRFDEAEEAFRAVAAAGLEAGALRWEALVRLGLVRAAAGDIRGSADVLREVRKEYSGDVEAMRFLKRAVTTVPGRSWAGFEEVFEDVLASARVVSIEAMGTGPDQPKKVHLETEESALDAIWKPIDRTPDSYRAEIAAYELDKLLGLGMVPPTVERSLEDRKGALQLWVLGCSYYPQVEDKAPATEEWRREVSRMRIFDVLIGNRGRNLKNFLVDSIWSVVLIDHARSFLEAVLEELPDRFDRALVDRLEALEPTAVRARLGRVLSEAQIRELFRRRDVLLARIEELIEEKGEAEVLF